MTLYSYAVQSLHVFQTRKSLTAVPPPTLGCRPVPTDINSCDVNGANPCSTDANSIGECVDLPAPSTNYTCVCKPGFAWTANACQGGLILSL
jgi:hypothetical protein